MSHQRLHQACTWASTAVPQQNQPRTRISYQRGRSEQAVSSGNPNVLWTVPRARCFNVSRLCD